MIPKPALRAIVGALACVLSGAVAAQVRYQGHGGGGGMPHGGYEAGSRGGFGAPRELRGSSYGFPAPYGGAPPRYAPPPQPRGYEGAPPRRPYEAPPGWRAAQRRPPGSEGPRPPGMEAPPMASLGFVIEGIQRRSPGRQLDAAVDYMDGRPVYRVLWLTQRGRRMDYIVDAETGVILSGR